MAKREKLGVMVCPECGRAGAEIKAQKNGLLYRWCADGCNAQFFARNAEQEGAMRKHMADAPVTDTAKPAQEPDPEQKARPEPIPEIPKKKGTGNPFLDLIQGAA